MDRHSFSSPRSRKTSTSSRNSSISSQISEYSLLILSLDQKTIPFTPVEWCTDPFPVSKHWAKIPDPQTTKLISNHAVELFRANQSQHGTNIVVRMDLQHNELTDQYSSTSITQLPDLESETPALVQATVPGGDLALTALLTNLKRQGPEDEIAELTKEVVYWKDREGAIETSEQIPQCTEIDVPTDTVRGAASSHNEVNKTQNIPTTRDKVIQPTKMPSTAVA